MRPNFGGTCVYAVEFRDVIVRFCQDTSFCPDTSKQRQAVSSHNFDAGRCPYNSNCRMLRLCFGQHGQLGEQWPSSGHDGAGKPIRCGGPDGNLFRGCVGAQSSELSMAEKWCGDQWREFGELHNARDDQFRQRGALYGVGQQLSRERNK